MSNLLLNRENQVRTVWKTTGFFLVLALISVPMVLMARLLKISPGRAQIYWIEVLVLYCASWVCLAFEKRGLSSIGLSWNRRWLLEFCLGAFGGLGLIGLTAVLIFFLGGFHWVYRPHAGAPTLHWPGIVWFWTFLFWLSVAYKEELLFRGFAFQRLVHGGGLATSLFVFAALFALAHWGNPGMHQATLIWATIDIFLAGILLGLCWQRTGSLAFPIGVHLGWNFAQGPLLGFGVSGTTYMTGIWTPVFHGKPDWFTGGEFGLDASLPCAVITSACILGLASWKGKQQSIEAQVSREFLP